MESIALKYLGIEQETIDTLREDSNGTEAFNRSIIRNWMYRNSGPDQAKVTFIKLLLHAILRIRLKVYFLLVLYSGNMKPVIYQYLSPFEQHGQQLKVELGVVTFSLMLKNDTQCVPATVFQFRMNLLLESAIKENCHNITQMP